jgi:hypothetical protein
LIGVCWKQAGKFLPFFYPGHPPLLDHQIVGVRGFSDIGASMDYMGYPTNFAEDPNKEVIDKESI